MTPPYLLAVDQGTSSTKTIIFDRQGDIVAAAARDLPIEYPRTGFVEQDPGEIHRSVVESVAACAAQFRDRGGSLADLAACGISNQRETFLLWDRGGRPLCKAISWQCERSVAVCERLRADGQSGEIAARTGLMITPYFSGTKLLWLLENDPGIRRAVQAGEAFFGTVDTWLLHRLTRGQCYATDHTNASRTLLFNIDTLAWDTELLSRWGLSGLRLPAVHPSVHPFGESDFDGALSRTLPIAAMIGDSHAAAFGEGCTRPGMAKVTIGTGSSVLVNVGAKRRAAGGGIVSTVCYSLPQGVQYALEGIIVSCAATIAWMRDQLGLFSDSGETEAMAREARDSRGVYVIPAFSGLGSPHWKMNLKASIQGLTFASGKNQVVRAALESIPYQIADVMEAIAASSGSDPAELRVDGGMTANSFVMQLLADLVAAPVVTIGTANVSALGAAALAGLGAGVYGGIDDLVGLAQEKRRFGAGPDAARAQQGYEGWRKLLRNL